MASIIDRASCSYNAQLGANLLLHHIGDACDMVKAVDSPAARLIFDTGHVQAMVEQRGREAQPRRGAARREAGIASRLLRNASQQYRARAPSSAPASGDTMAAVDGDERMSSIWEGRTPVAREGQLVDCMIQVA